MAAGEQVLLGTRVPSGLKKRLSAYCHDNGMKMTFCVTQAIQRYLDEIASDAGLYVEAQDRMRKPLFVGQSEMDGYLTKRGIKRVSR